MNKALLPEKGLFYILLMFSSFVYSQEDKRDSFIQKFNRVKDAEKVNMLVELNQVEALEYSAYLNDSINAVLSRAKKSGNKALLNRLSFFDARIFFWKHQYNKAIPVFYKALAKGEGLNTMDSIRIYAGLK